MNNNLVTLIGGAFLLSVLHALIPNHWVPFVLLGRERGWQSPRLMFVTFLGGAVHLTSTILIGVVIGSLGLAISAWHEAALRWVGPIVLTAAGLWVFLRGGHFHDHPPSRELSPVSEHRHGDSASSARRGTGRLDARDLATVGTLCVMMFFSPCLEMEAYYVIAARHGWVGIAVVSLVYLLIVVALMMALVAAAARGLERLRWSFFERHENRLNGGVLILLGLAWAAFPL